MMWKKYRKRGAGRRLKDARGTEIVTSRRGRKDKRSMNTRMINERITLSYSAALQTYEAQIFVSGPNHQKKNHPKTKGDI